MKRHSLRWRLLAYIIDMILIGILGNILMSIGIGGAIDYTDPMSSIGSSTLPSMLAAAIYFVGFVFLNEGVTVGKMLCKLSIEEKGGMKMERNKLIIRELVKVVLSPISFISFIVCIFSEERYSIHDMIMSSVVVRGN